MPTQPAVPTAETSKSAQRYASPEDIARAQADIPFETLKNSLSVKRTDILCDHLAADTAHDQQYVDQYWQTVYKDTADLQRRFPQHRNYLRDVNASAHMAARALSPQYLRKQCNAY